MRALTDIQLKQLDEDGYLVVEGVLSQAQLDDLRAEYAAILDRIAPELVARGSLSEPYDHLPFEQRYTAMISEMEDMYDVYQHLDICFPLVEDLAPDARMSDGPAVFGLLTNPKLLDVVEDVIGPEIYCNPVQHTRIKPPAQFLPSGVTDANVARTLWHQDQAVLEPEAEESNVLTVWVAITDATIENGCLTCVPSSHRREVSLHCPGKIFPAEIYIPDELVDPASVAPLPVRAGGVVLLHRRTEHASLDNTTNQIRWSFDLRYQPPGEPTGRPYFPGFLARSTKRPDEVVTDHVEWAALWYQARDRLASGETHLALADLWGPNAGHHLCA